MAKGFTTRKDDARKAVLSIVVERVHQRLGITSEGTELLAPREVLICGHIVRIVQDIYGETNAYKRRCHECGRIRDRVNALSAGANQ